MLPVAFSGRDGRLVDANHAFLRLVGYSRQELGTSIVRWADLTPTEYRPNDERGLEEARSLGACAPFEKQLTRRDGVRIPVLVGYTRLDGPRYEYVTFIRDL